MQYILKGQGIVFCLNYKSNGLNIQLRFAAICILTEQHDHLHNLHSHTNMNRTQIINKKTKVTKQHEVTLCSQMCIMNQQNASKKKK